MTVTGATTVTFEGTFRRGLREGPGTETVENSAAGTKLVREGRWKRDKSEDGEWTVTFQDGAIYSGECVDGRPDGRGIVKYANRDVFTGGFKNGLRHGEGVLIFENGEEFEGSFHADRPVGLDFFSSSTADGGRAGGGRADGGGGASDAPCEQAASSADQVDVTLFDVNLGGERCGDPSWERKEEKRKEEQRMAQEAYDSSISGGGANGGDAPQVPASETSAVSSTHKLHRYSNGATFAGALDSSGLRQGHGVYTNPNKSRLEGTFVDDFLTGEGEMIDEHSRFVGVLERNNFVSGTYVT